MTQTAVQNPHFVLHVNTESPQLFSTLLQSGIQVAALPDETIETFLEKLPGFTKEYILREVQTIFLNGTATDDLETPLSGEKPTLAITTAMPGLAGAIFRKDSPHAPLRTTPEAQEPVKHQASPLVTLKIFTSIAKEMGPTLLERGVDLKGDNLHSFLHYRPSLLAHIRSILVDGQPVSEGDMFTILNNNETVHLSVHT